MKKFALIIMFSLLSELISILNNDNIIIKDIEYSKEFELDPSLITDENMDLYFRFSLPSNKNNLAIIFKIFTNEGNNLNYPKINLYTEKPEDEEIKNSDKSAWTTLYDKYKRKYKIYTDFTYSLSPIENESFGVIYLRINEKYNYFSILMSNYHDITNIYAATLTFNKEYNIPSEKLSYTNTYFNLILKAENHDKNESIIINLSENDINDLEIELEGSSQMIGPDSTLIKNFENYTSCEKNGELITYEYNYGKISSEHKYLSMVIKSKDGYMLKHFSIRVGNDNFISFGLLYLISILLLIF